MKRKILICDVDGTLSDPEERLHYVRREGKKDWKGFFSEMRNDTVNEDVRDTVYGLYTIGWDIIVVSGRSSDYKRWTRDWLENICFTEDMLWEGPYMREFKDHRPDTIVKKEIFESIQQMHGSKDDVQYMAVDDRNQVVDMWRSEGIRCLQVAKGDF